MRVDSDRLPLRFSCLSFNKSLELPRQRPYIIIRACRSVGAHQVTLHFERRVHAVARLDRPGPARRRRLRRVRRGSGPGEFSRLFFSLLFLCYFSMYASAPSSFSVGANGTRRDETVSISRAGGGASRANCLEKFRASARRRRVSRARNIQYARQRAGD